MRCGLLIRNSIRYVGNNVKVIIDIFYGRIIGWSFYGFFLGKYFFLGEFVMEEFYWLWELVLLLMDFI